MKNAKTIESGLCRIIKGEIKGPGAFLIKFLLSCLEWIYLLLWKLDTRRTNQVKLPVPVISVGNVIAGGTGKTPTVVWLAHFLVKKGMKPAILTRGYRSKSQTESLVFTAQDLSALTPAETGDEPYLLAKSLPKIPIGVGRNRFQTGLKIIEKYPEVNLFILDDGFQYRELVRELDIVLIDAQNPFGYNHLIPRGFLREPLTGLKRADLIFLTRSDTLSDEKVADITGQIRVYNQEASIIRVIRKNPSLTCMGQNDKTIPISEVKGRKVGVITAIGNPDQFRESVVNTGAIVEFFRSYPDHYYWSEADITGIVGELKQNKIDILIVTAKDEVKLAAYINLFTETDVSCYILNLEFTIDEHIANDLIINTL